MKLKLTACIVLLYVSFLTCSGQPPQKVVIQTDAGSGICKLLYTAKDASNVKVSILNSKDETIFTETLTKISSFVRPYNFNELGAGDFSLVVEDKDGQIKKPVLFKTNKVESMIDVSKIANSQNKYLLSIENKDADQIQVKIIDDTNGVLREETLSVNGKFSIIYNLNKVKTTPVFEVTGNNGVLKTFTFK